MPRIWAEGFFHVGNFVEPPPVPPTVDADGHLIYCLNDAVRLRVQVPPGATGFTVYRRVPSSSIYEVSPPAVTRDRTQTAKRSPRAKPVIKRVARDSVADTTVEGVCLCPPLVGGGVRQRHTRDCPLNSAVRHVGRWCPTGRRYDVGA